MPAHRVDEYSGRLATLVSAWPGPELLAQELRHVFADIDAGDAAVAATQKQALELALRDSVLGEAMNEVTTDDCRLTRLLLVAAEAARVGLAGDNSLLLLEEALETQTIPACEHIFRFLERHATLFTPAGLDTTKGKGLVLLRLVNDLLRRLSKSRHAAFCGRIRTFLAKAISLTDRSGVNQMGLSNVEAAVEPDPAVPLPQDVPGQEDGELEAADRMETDDGVDARLYHSFWGLQTFFSNPRLCYEAPALVKMSQALSLVLDHFAANPVDDYGGARSTAAPPLKRKRGDGDDERLLAPLTRSEHFFPKYLASASLFDLELRSAPLRRQVLLQALLLLDHLLDCTPERKLQLASAPNKSVVPSLVLTDAMKSELRALRVQARRVLKHTPPDGHLFLRLVDELMRREGGWVQWKRNNCQRFERPATDDQLAEPPRVRRAPLAADSVDMFNPELNRLWNNNSDMDAYLRDSGSDLAVPALMTYLDILAQQLDPENAIEAEYRNSRDPIYAWRALRLAATELLDKLPADTKTAVTASDGARLPSAEHVLASLTAPPVSEPVAADAGEQPAASATAASQDAGTAAMNGDTAADASPADGSGKVDQPPDASPAPHAQADDSQVPDQMDVDHAPGADEKALAADAQALAAGATVPADHQAAE